MSVSPAGTEQIYRTLIALDIERFGDPGRDDQLRGELRDTLQEVVAQVRDDSGIPARYWSVVADTGDGLLLLVDPAVETSRVLVGLLDHLPRRLAAKNRRMIPAARLRLRVLVHVGHLMRRDRAVYGAEVNLAFRLLDSQELRACLRAASSPLVVGLSEEVFERVVRQRARGLDPDAFRPVDVTTKDVVARAWVHVGADRELARWVREAGSGRTGFTAAALLVAPPVVAPPLTGVATLRRRHKWMLWLAGSALLGLVCWRLVSWQLGLIVICLAVVGGRLWRWRLLGPRRLDTVAEGLAKAVETQWRIEEKLLRLNDPYPAPLRWVNAQPPLADHWAAIHGTPGQDEELDLSGDLQSVVDVLARVPSRRLVVLGEPGAGKTVLTLCLVLKLLDRREPGDRVPVRLPVGSWDPAETNLRDWMARRLREDYPALRNRAWSGMTWAQELIAAGRVLPVLDGLDEIPAPLRASALAALNRELSRDDPLVLTCRLREYEEAVTREGDVLTAAAVVELLPLSQEDLRRYLEVTTPRSRVATWDPVFADLREQPGGPLARALSTPLMAWLARTAYGDTPADPAELLAVDQGGNRVLADREAVEAHLLDRFIPAIYGQHSQTASRRRWPIAGVQRWLRFLAAHLYRRETSELAWWRLQEAVPGPVFGVVIGALCALYVVVLTRLQSLVYQNVLQLDVSVHPLRDAIAVGLASGLTVALVRPFGPARGQRRLARTIGAFFPGFIIGLVVTLPFGTYFAPIGGLMVGFARLAGQAPVQIRFRGTARPFLPRFALGFPAGAALAYLIGISPLSWYGLVPGLGLALLCGATVWFAAPADPARAPSPRGTLKQDRAASFALWLVLAMAFGLVSGLAAVWLIEQVPEIPSLLDLALGPKLMIAAGTLVVLLLVIAPFGIALILTGTWGYFLISRVWLALLRRLPWHLIQFLADAHRRGVLRQIGGVYEFRHARLRDRLAAQATAQATGAVKGRRRAPDLLGLVGRAPRRLRAAASMVAIAGALSYVFVVQGQMVVSPIGSGFVWADLPTDARYLPYESGNPYVFNSAGDIEVRRRSTGDYVVGFRGLATEGGVAHVTAYGGSSAFCVLGQPPPADPAGTAKLIRVLCFASDGLPVDTRFVLNFASRFSGDGRYSYFMLEAPSTARRSTPDERSRYDSTGGTAWIERRSAGQYEAYVPASVGVEGGSQFYQITSVGTAAHCKLAAAPSSAGIQRVACRDAHGRFVDAPFALSFSSRASFIGRADRPYGYASSQDRDSVLRLETGFYQALLPDVGANSGQVIVYAIGGSDAYCHVVNWATENGRDMAVGIACWSALTHEPADSQFAVGVSW